MITELHTFVSEVPALRKLLGVLPVPSQRVVNPVFGGYLACTCIIVQKQTDYCFCTVAFSDKIKDDKTVYLLLSKERDAHVKVTSKCVLKACIMCTTRSW